MQVLVIGGTGPTGPHLVNGLIDQGHTVTQLQLVFGMVFDLTGGK